MYLSQKEYDELAAEFPDTVDKRIDRLSEYIKNKGCHYSDHADVIRRWSKCDHADRYKQPEPTSELDADEYLAAALARSARYLERNRATEQ